MGADPFTIAAFVVGGALAGFSVQQQMKAGKAADEAAEAERRRQELDASRQRRRLIREGQAKRASVIASGEAQGASGSSAVSQGSGAVTSDTASGLHFIGLTENLRDQRFNAMKDMRKHQQMASFASKGSSFALTAATGGFGSLSKKEAPTGNMGTMHSPFVGNS